LPAMPAKSASNRTLVGLAIRVQQRPALCHGAS
jgi:hypothetical protein